MTGYRRETRDNRDNSIRRKGGISKKTTRDRGKWRGRNRSGEKGQRIDGRGRGNWKKIYRREKTPQKLPGLTPLFGVTWGIPTTTKCSRTTKITKYYVR